LALDKTNEYETFFKVSEMFINGNNGFVTDRDDLFIDFDEVPLARRMQQLLGGKLSAEFIQRYRIVASSSYDIQKKIAGASFSNENIRRCMYRPFDVRYVYYSNSITSRPAYDVMRHMSGDNVGLILARLIVRSDAFDACFVSRNITEKKCGDSTRSSYLFPLYQTDSSTKRTPGDLFRKRRQTNLTKTVTQALSEAFGLLIVGEGHGDLTATLGPEDLLAYVYAVLYSPRYRERYGERLKIDFPRVPIPRTSGLFRDLARLGDELVALHLMESHKLHNFMTSYTGPKNPEVERVGWSGDTVWLDATATRKGHIATPGTIGFRGVPEAVWDFHIGGYRVCEKWLKDRKGRDLLPLNALDFR
jgi:predicted helicase